MSATVDHFQLDRTALVNELTEQLVNWGLESPADYTLDLFGESGGPAVAILCETFLEPALLQPAGSAMEIVVYAIESDYENPILVAVRDKEIAEVQVSSLSLNGNRLADSQYDRSGLALFAEILEDILHEANRLAPELQTLLQAKASANASTS